MSVAGQSSQPLNDIVESKPSSCFHCGEICSDNTIHIDEKVFCCTGCKTVYEILNDNGMCRYYEIDENAGISLRGRPQAEYAYLDDPDVRSRLIDFSDSKRTKITFYLPQIHCASCIWLLENLYKLSEGVLASKVNFLKKEIYISFDEDLISLRRLVELLASIGYAPAINLSDLDQEDKPVINRSFFYKLGVAGFAFGNIMLLSFPEYLGLEQATDPFYFKLFGYLNILLALPVVFYSGRDYLQSAYLGLRQGTLNIDVPISLGILTLFGRSVFEIMTNSGAGYLDSLAGLVFFLLTGKWFQQRTYHNISFERDYRSYFPIAARKKDGQAETTVSLDRLEAGDVIIIRHGELIPADSLLIRGQGHIDYSFVTGESEPVAVNNGEKVYAGGRQTGATIEVSLTRKVSQSYLTQLWNDEAFTKKQDSRASRLADRIGKIFTIVILLVAGFTLLFWLPRDTATAINAFTAVLIIACPCAVALAIPFIFGNAVRILGRNRFFLKNTQVIEGLREFSATVFDKTGTITRRMNNTVEWVGRPLDATERAALLAVSNQSTHPASRQISQFLREKSGPDEDLPAVSDWEEVVGQGIRGRCQDHTIRLGAFSFLTAPLTAPPKQGTYLQIDEEIAGYFQINHAFRSGARQVLNFFRARGPIFLLSGDNDRERPLLEPHFGDQVYFRQSPHDKLAFVRQLQEKEKQRVLMLGDGLNDAGALQQSNVGIVVAEDTNNFTPACDAIIDAAKMEQLPRFINFARRSVRLVFRAYGLALIYNIIGLSFAVQGALSPIVAAILMPASSISIVLFGILSSNWLAQRLGL